MLCEEMAVVLDEADDSNADDKYASTEVAKKRDGSGMG